MAYILNFGLSIEVQNKLSHIAIESYYEQFLFDYPNNRAKLSPNQTLN